MRIGVQPITTHHDLALVGNVGGKPGDEIQIIHPLHLFGVTICRTGAEPIPTERYQLLLIAPTFCTKLLQIGRD